MRRGHASLCLGAVITLLAGVGCGALVDLSGLTGGCVRGVCADAAAGADAESLAEAAPPDVLDAGEAGPVGDAAAPCTGKPGPVEVRVPIDDGGAYCIDSTEVTNRDYERFLAQRRSSDSVPAECAWKMSDFTPGAPWPRAGGDMDLPVAMVDWCDGAVYCKWAHKRLCGAIGAGPLGYNLLPQKNRGEWFRACVGPTGSKPTDFPYGETYDAGACNGVDRNQPGPLPVSEQTACIGGYPSIRDMSGNVWEWFDSCATSGGKDDSCRKAGGAYNSPSGELACGFNAGIEPRSSRQATVGFRCCSDP